MKIGVIGCGSIGKRHIQNIKKLLDERKDGSELIAFDVSEEVLTSVREKYKVRTCSELNKVLQEAEGVFICTPNHLHASQALQAVKNNCHVFIEKPLAHTQENVDDLLSLAKEKERIVTVGYMLRFYEPLKKIKELLDQNAIGKVYGGHIECGQYLPSWRPTVDYSKNYGAIKSQGGGVILDIIHEINYAKWLFGPIIEVFCMAGTLSDLEINTEDFAKILLKNSSGALISLHLDYLQQTYSRNCKIIGEKGTITWDFFGHQVRWYHADKKKWETLFAQENLDINEAYLEEEKQFLNGVAGGKKPIVSGEEAKEDLRIALAALQSAAKKEPVYLGGSMQR